MTRIATLGRALVFLVGVGLALVVGVALFGVVPARMNVGVVTVVLVAAVVLVGVRMASNAALTLFPDYNAAEVRVEGPIVQRSETAGLAPGRIQAAADDLVEQIHAADDDDAAQALVVRLDTPGGEPVASDDIRAAAADFDGPTVAYAKGMCASGGYMVACGCDEFHAREDGLVGSIGVIANQRKFADLAERHGVHLERFTGGEYKDTFDPMKRLDDDERDYFQSVIDSSYDSFVELVADSRDVDADTVRDTEARLYHAPQALDDGLVDTVGSRTEMEEALADRVGVDDLSFREFEPAHPLSQRISLGVQRAAHAAGAGLASVLTDDETRVEFRER